MKKQFVLFFIVLMCLFFIYASSEKVQDVKPSDLNIIRKDTPSGTVLRPDLEFGKIPLYFIANKGQVNKKARFYARASRYSVRKPNQES